MQRREDDTAKAAAKNEPCGLYQQPGTTNYWWYIRADSSLSCVHQVSVYRMVVWYIRAEEASFPLEIICGNYMSRCLNVQFVSVTVSRVEHYTIRHVM